MDGDGSVGVYGVDGALQTVLDGSNSCCGDFDPVWSPDGAPSILIRHRDADGQPIVFELPLDRTTPRPVPRDDPRSMLYSADSKQPVVYSPDGSRAAFFESSLAVVDADGTGRRDLVAGADGEVVGWSPNGGEIAFVDAPAARLSVVDVASGSVTTIATGSGISAEGFSPDGDRVLYTTPRGLWAANADGSGARVLVEGADSGAWLAPRSDAAPSHAP
jgi:Tol biopolymer transport system component